MCSLSTFLLCWQKQKGQSTITEIDDDDDDLIPMGKDVRMAVMKLDLEAAGGTTQDGELLQLLLLLLIRSARLTILHQVKK